MMNFRLIKNGLINLLGSAANNRYRVIGFQEQGKAATEIQDTGRSVKVYYSRGDLPKSSASTTGPFQHKMDFDIDLAVSKASEGDLAALENSNATSNQIASALLNFQQAAKLADDSIDELIEIIFQIVMDARNIDLGLENIFIGGRWITDIEKNGPIKRGDLVVLTGSMILNCNIDEQVSGEVPSEAGEIIESALEIKTDSFGKAGTLTGS